MEQLIFKKIPAIMREIEPIAKGRKNAQQGYSYRGVDDVMNELSPILAKHSVFPVTTICPTTSMEVITSKSGTSGYHAVRTYGFRLYAEDGSFIEGAVEGEASDWGDKAAGKAHSYAYRDFLMKTFCIPTEGDHDTDANTPVHVPQPQKQATATPSNEPAVRWVTEKQFLGIKQGLMSGDADFIAKGKANFKALTTPPYAMKKEYKEELTQIIKNIENGTI